MKPRDYLDGTWLDTPSVNDDPSLLGIYPPISKAVDTTPWHSRPVFDGHLNQIATWAASEVKLLDAQAVVALGHSGLVLAGAVGLLADVPVFAVRRAGEATVSGEGNEVTGFAPQGPVDRWVFLDDFISSGGTLYRSMQVVWKNGLVATPQPAAILNYRDSGRGTRLTLAGSILRSRVTDSEPWDWPTMVEIPLRVYPGHLE